MTGCLVQSDMKEAASDVVELQDMDGAVLEALVSAMYGEQGVDVGHLLAPLFVAADAHQVMEP